MSRTSWSAVCSTLLLWAFFAPGAVADVLRVYTFWNSEFADALGGSTGWMPMRPTFEHVPYHYLSGDSTESASYDGYLYHWPGFFFRTFAIPVTTTTSDGRNFSTEGFTYVFRGAWTGGPRRIVQDPPPNPTPEGYRPTYSYSQGNGRTAYYYVTTTGQYERYGRLSAYVPPDARSVTLTLDDLGTEYNPFPTEFDFPHPDAPGETLRVRFDEGGQSYYAYYEGASGEGFIELYFAPDLSTLDFFFYRYDEGDYYIGSYRISPDFTRLTLEDHQPDDGLVTFAPQILWRSKSYTLYTVGGGNNGHRGGFYLSSEYDRDVPTPLHPADWPNATTYPAPNEKPGAWFTLSADPLYIPADPVPGQVRAPSVVVAEAREPGGPLAEVEEKAKNVWGEDEDSSRENDPATIADAFDKSGMYVQSPDHPLATALNNLIHFNDPDGTGGLAGGGTTLGYGVSIPTWTGTTFAQGGTYDVTWIQLFRSASDWYVLLFANSMFQAIHIKIIGLTSLLQIALAAIYVWHRVWWTLGILNPEAAAPPTAS